MRENDEEQAKQEILARFKRNKIVQPLPVHPAAVSKETSARSENVSSKTSSKKEATPVKPTGSIQSKETKTPSQPTKQERCREEKVKSDEERGRKHSSKKPRVRDKKATSDPRDKAQDAPGIAKVQDQQPQQNPPTSSGFFFFRCLETLYKQLCALLSRIINNQPAETSGAAFIDGNTSKTLTTLTRKNGCDLDQFVAKERPKPSSCHRLLTCCGIFSCSAWGGAG